MSEINSGIGVEGIVTANLYDTDTLRKEYSNWDKMSRSEKYNATKNIDPVETDTVYNVTTVAMHEYFVDNLNPNNINDEANVSAKWVALGTGGSSPDDNTQADLNNRQYSEEADSIADNNDELIVSAFLEAGIGNGNDFNEIGIFTGDPDNLSNADVFKLNHATFSAISKDSTQTLTFDVSLIFQDV